MSDDSVAEDSAGLTQLAEVPAFAGPRHPASLCLVTGAGGLWDQAEGGDPAQTRKFFCMCSGDYQPEATLTHHLGLSDEHVHILLAQ